MERAIRDTWDDHRVDTTPPQGRQLPIRWLGLILAAATVLNSACETSPLSKPTPVPSTSAAAAAPTCPEPGVVINTGAIDAAMGLRAMNIEMVNCGTRPYKVDGYPAVRVLDANQKALNVKVSNGSSPITTIKSFDAAPKPVTLQPGEKVVAGLVWRNTVTNSTVTAANGIFLDIAPVDGEPRQTVKSGSPIDLGNTGKLGVSPWQVRQDHKSPHRQSEGPDTAVPVTPGAEARSTQVPSARPAPPSATAASGRRQSALLDRRSRGFRGIV
jgi:hypothetical protein